MRRPAPLKKIAYLGLDAHKEFTEVPYSLYERNNQFTHLKQWRYYPAVKAIQALRGVRLLVATGVITELGDLSRFDTPRKLMSDVGLTPSEHSSGDKRRQELQCG